MISVGRNDPCPCGSGKKYKNCCLGQPSNESSFKGPEKVFTDLRQALHEHEFASLEEVQAFARPLPGISCGKTIRRLLMIFKDSRLCTFREDLFESAAYSARFLYMAWTKMRYPCDEYVGEP